jgi:hypothetical protein
LSISNCRFFAFKSAIDNWQSAMEAVMSADKDLISVQQARDLVEAAHRAQSEVVRFDQAR